MIPSRRRARDLTVAAIITALTASAAVLLYLGGDSRATTYDPAAASAVPAAPTPATTPPVRLTRAWQLPVDPDYGSVVTPYGTVVTADRHTVTGFDATTGTRLWSYGRSNLDLCGIGSGDTTAADLSSWSGVHGVMTVFAKNGFCSQVTLLDPATGERLYQRTSPGSDPGGLFFGAPYVGWLGSDYLELWRHDLVATIRYGNQPQPVNADGPHTGCRFTDAAVTRLQLATIEHCEDTGTDAQVVLNWPTPEDAPTDDDHDWDANHSEPKATIDTGSSTAVIAGISDDRIAVVVADPAPALVVYDSDGVERHRLPLDLDPADITATAAAGPAPAVTYQDRRYTLIGSHLLSVSGESVTVPSPPGDGNDDGPAVEQDLRLDWTLAGVRGLPGHLGFDLLVPVADGIAVAAVATGEVGRVLAVDREGDSGRIDIGTVGTIVVEQREQLLVGFTSTR